MKERVSGNVRLFPIKLTNWRGSVPVDVLAKHVST
jgi:hypothetical protein